MKTVEIRLERNDGKMFVIDNTNWIIPSNGLDNFGKVKNDIGTMSNAIGDGSIVTSDRIKETDRTVKCVVGNPQKNEELRHEAIRFFNVKSRYKMHITYMGKTRWCDGLLYQVQISEGNVYERVKLQFTMLSPNPFLKSEFNFGKNIAAVTPMNAFPFLCTQESGVVSGRFDFGKDVMIKNDGDVPTNCIVEVVATGEVVNPKFQINNNYIRLIDTLQNGDVIKADFEKQPPEIKKNGVNVMGKLDRTSSLDEMQLNVGENIINYSADTGDTYMKCSVFYNKLYVLI